MESKRLATWTRTLRHNRREAVGLVLVGLAGPGLVTGTSAAGRCIKPGKKCGKGKKCCGGAKCSKRICTCPPERRACGKQCIDAAACCADADCGACERCEDHLCAPLTGEICGHQTGGGAIRCCNGTCPVMPACRVVGTACLPGESIADCLAACCSRRVGCSGADCACDLSEPGDPCASDSDCTYEIDGHAGATHCLCHTCYIDPGEAVQAPGFVVRTVVAAPVWPTV